MHQYQVPQSPSHRSQFSRLGTERATVGRGWANRFYTPRTGRLETFMHKAKLLNIATLRSAAARAGRTPPHDTRHTAHCKSATQDVQVHARAHHDSQNTSAPATTASADRRHTRSAHQAKREQSESKVRKRSRTGQLALSLGTRLSRRHVRESALPAAPHTAAHAV